ncbi:hypothetical protein BM1374166_01616 [Bartonella tribocorum]|nr:hypothetical protein BM1374166_01616 [Bartonella tribocorum]
MKGVNMAEGIALGYRRAWGFFMHSVQIGKSMDKRNYQEFFSIMFFLLVCVDILFGYVCNKMFFNFVRCSY